MRCGEVFCSELCCDEVVVFLVSCVVVRCFCSDLCCVDVF